MATRQSEIDALEGANDMLTVDNVLLQSEIDALKAQVEGLILQAGDMEKLAIEHMLERDAALIQVDELKVQVEELKADAGCIVSCDDGSLVTVREFHKDIQTIANTVIAEAEEKDG